MKNYGLYIVNITYTKCCVLRKLHILKFMCSLVAILVYIIYIMFGAMFIECISIIMTEARDVPHSTLFES